jgi:4,5-DOPA dioxygenase extradiol
MTGIKRMPALFVGHGSPMVTLGDNTYTRAWRSLGETLPRPRAVLCVSAHWYLPATLVTGDERPRTIHDFGGFPKSLYDIEYPAPGDPALAKEVAELLSPTEVALDAGWGLDHGSWTVLRHIFPEANVPVIQLSLNRSEDAARHYELAEQLQPLRDDNILIVGSGNLVHNLRRYDWSGDRGEPFEWAERFESMARQRMRAADFEPLVNYKELGPDAMMAAPTPDHYLPLLYVLAQHDDRDRVSFPVEGFDGGSMSMLAVRIG